MNIELLALPRDLIKTIFNNFTVLENARAATVCRLFSEIVREKTVEFKLIEKYFTRWQEIYHISPHYVPASRRKFIGYFDNVEAVRNEIAQFCRDRSISMDIFVNKRWIDAPIPFDTDRIVLPEQALPLAQMHSRYNTGRDMSGSTKSYIDLELRFTVPRIF